jgi:hypothetical protein
VSLLLHNNVVLKMNSKAYAFEKDNLEYLYNIIQLQTFVEVDMKFYGHKTSILNDTIGRGQYWFLRSVMVLPFALLVIHIYDVVEPP